MVQVESFPKFVRQISVFAIFYLRDKRILMTLGEDLYRTILTLIQRKNIFQLLSLFV